MKIPIPNPRLILILTALLAGALLFWAIWLRVPAHIPLPAEAARPGPPRTLRLGLNIAAGSALHKAALRFAEQVGERSKGRLQVQVFPDQQLGNDDQMLEMARNGQLDFLLIPSAKLSSAIPAMQYADLPFYFSSREELYAMLDGEPGQMLLAKLHQLGLVGLTFWENGFKQFTANRPIHSPEDFAGLRIRTMKSRLIAEQFAALGAQPIPIDFHRVRQALAEQAVDGQENPLVAIVAMGIHEVQKHLTLSHHAYLGYVFAASKPVFETLSPGLRQVIQDTARELTQWEREETARLETGLIETIRAAGVEIHTLTPGQRQRFSAVMAPLADHFGFEVGYDLLGKTGELRYLRQMPAAGKEPLIIGLDADLSNNGVLAGGAIYRGMQLAQEEINQKGGLLGRPLQILARDHGGNPSVGRQNLAWFARLPRMLAVMGGQHSAVILAEMEDIHRLQLPYLVPWAANHDVMQHGHSPSYLFRASLDDQDVAPVLLGHALGQGGTVGMLLERSAWGRSNAQAIAAMLARLPAGRVNIQWVNPGDPDIGLQTEALLQRGVRSLVLVLQAHETQAAVKAVAQQDEPVPVFSHWGMTGGNFFAAAQHDLQRVDLRFVQTVVVDDAHRRPALNAFLERYRKRYGQEAPVPALMGSVHAYDLVHLLARAVTQARSQDREAIRRELEQIPHHAGVMQDYKRPFSPDDHDALDRRFLRLARYDAAGNIVAVQ
ncbi:MAG: DctP family TRAP transporter solute-binding subunit [Azovibrio sp.]|uniref:DctP family TRAP transporter solute-binding subunit n=1 Tax=Azovibrio sp. TaxID=1872673 RepID=UPI003C75A7B0